MQNMQAESNSTRHNDWVNIVFFSITTFFGLIIAPWYVFKNGLSLVEIWLTVFYLIATGMSITVGYHRLFAHATYKAHPIVRFLLLFFGAAAFEQCVLDWASQHRDHHRYVDQDMDPYSIKRGFWYAHIGWLLFYSHKLHYENAQDLQKDPMVMHQAKYYVLWAAVSGIILPVVIGGLFGYAWGAFLVAVCFRITFVYHATFCINSVCHMFGKPTYDVYSTAKDHWFVAFLTYGEGYHNFHHRFPSDYRNAVRWYQWDPSKWMIKAMSWLGLVWDLKTVSKFRIMEARIMGENQLASDALASLKQSPTLNKAMETLKLQQHNLRVALSNWEIAIKEYQTSFQQKSHDLAQNARVKVEETKENFYEARRNWLLLTRLAPDQLEKFLLSATARN